MRRIRPGNSKLAIAYLRVSTDKQELGPEAQRAAIEAWARREGVGLIDWTEDRLCGETELEDRPGLLLALSALSRHGAGLLLIAKRDRLARDAAVAAFIERAVRKAGACVISADGVGNGETPADQFMRTILDGAAQFERALIRQRTKDAAAAKQGRGERAGTVPYGYRVADEGPRNKAGRVQRIEEDPEEQAVLRWIGVLRAERRSLREITKALEAAGIVGRTGQPLKLTQVARLAARSRLGGEGAPAPPTPAP